MRNSGPLRSKHIERGTTPEASRVSAKTGFATLLLIWRSGSMIQSFDRRHFIWQGRVNGGVEDASSIPPLCHDLLVQIVSGSGAFQRSH
jgi:hypothetical protein